jgi:O-antigen biosynthesis protein
MQHDGLPAARRLIDIELGEPLPTVEPAVPPGNRGRLREDRVFILVRLHTLPLGTVDLAVPPGGLAPDAVGGAIATSLGPELAKHLADDRLAAVDVVAAGGLPAPAAPRCLAARRAFLATAPAVTVVVPVADRPDLLTTCLTDLVAQTYPRAEIIVVDNAPERSGARAVVDGVDPSRSMRYVVERTPGSSRARNRGLRESTTAITAFLDADVRVDRHWLGDLVRPIAADDHVGAASGLILPAELRTPAQAWLLEWGGYDKGFEPRLFDLDAHRDANPLYPYQPGLFGSGQSMAFRTDVLRRIGGFDLALGVRTASEGGEDLAALMDVVLTGHRLAYVPSAIVWHPDPADRAAFLAKLESYAVGLAALMVRTAIRHPRSVPALARRAPGALIHLFGRRSPRNRRRSPTFPARAVTLAELRGLVRGSVAYPWSVLEVRRRSRGAA